MDAKIAHHPEHIALFVAEVCSIKHVLFIRTIPLGNTDYDYQRKSSRDNRVPRFQS